MKKKNAKKINLLRIILSPLLGIFYILPVSLFRVTVLVLRGAFNWLDGNSEQVSVDGICKSDYKKISNPVWRCKACEKEVSYKLSDWTRWDSSVPRFLCQECYEKLEDCMDIIYITAPFPIEDVNQWINS